MIATVCVARLHAGLWLRRSRRCRQWTEAPHELGHEVIEQWFPGDGEAFFENFFSLWRAEPTIYVELARKQLGREPDDTLFEPWWRLHVLGRHVGPGPKFKPRHLYQLMCADAVRWIDIFPLPAEDCTGIIACDFCVAVTSTFECCMCSSSSNTTFVDSFTAM